MALALVAVPLLSAAAIDTVPPPLDPQSWKLLRDTNWNDFKPNPVIDWMTEQNPDSLYNSSRHAGGNANLGIPEHRKTPINGAIILVDFWDRPFLMLGEKNTDLFGWHTFDANDSYQDYLAKIERGDPVTKNPQRVVKDEAELLKFWEDYLNKKITDPTDNAFNHGSNTDEFWREVSYGKWNVDLKAFGVFHLEGLEMEYGLDYTSMNDLPPTFRRSSQRNFVNESIAAANAGNAWLGDFDFFFICHAGYDESGVWQEFGQVQWANGADVPYEYGVRAKMDEIEILFTKHPEYLVALNTRGGYSQTTIRDEAAKVVAHQAAGTLDQYEFKFPASDWTWANNYIGQGSQPGTAGGANTAPTRYVKWTSWAAAATRWASSSGYGGTSVRSSWGTNVTNIPYSQQAECNGMATYAHEFGHIVNLPDNYSSPFSDTVSARTEPWDLMARGCFAGPFGDHARWSLPGGLEADSAPVHMMFPSKRFSGFYDAGDIYTLSVANLKTAGPVVKEVVARNIPMNNGGYYPQLEQYGLIAPNFYKAIELTFDSANTDKDTLVTRDWSNTRSRAVSMSVEVVERTGYDSYAPDDGVILTRLASATNGSGYQVVDSHLGAGIQTMHDYYLNGSPVAYPIAHQVHLFDAAFKAGVSTIDTGYYEGSEYQYDPRGDKSKVISGNTVNEYYDTANGLHFYILERHDNPGKFSTFLSYSIGLLHDDGPAVSGALKIEPKVAEGESWNRVAVVNFKITNSGASATDIIRVAADGGDLDAVILNDLYAIGVGETVTVPVYVSIPAGVTDASMLKLSDIKLSAASESNAANRAVGAVKAAEVYQRLLINVNPVASVKKLNGNKNDLTVTVTETYEDKTTEVFTKTFSINNNAADTYTVGPYKVYVDTKGNDQIRACYVVK